MDKETIEFLATICILGLIPATIAAKKGRSFILWWFLGSMLIIVALPASILAKPIHRNSGLRKCHMCAEDIQMEAVICKHCGTTLPKLSEQEKKNIIRERNKSESIPWWQAIIAITLFGVAMWVYIDSLVHPNRQNNITVSALNLSVGKLGNKVITGVATNITDRTLSYAQIEFNIYDKYNTQVGSTMTNINNFEPHSKWEFEAPVIEETASTTKLKKITSY